MPLGRKRQTAARRAAALAVLFGIALVTLYPTADARDQEFTLCLACGEYGTLDLLLNVALFVPLGALLGRPDSGRWDVVRVVLMSAVLSLAIEGAQLAVVPGRDPSLSDLVGNSLGAALGAIAVRVGSRAVRMQPHTWLRLTWCWVLLSASALAFGVWAVGLEVPYRGYYVQWQPSRPGYAPFLGKVVALSLNNVKLNPEDAFSPWLLPVSFFHGHIRIIADVIPGPRPNGLALIARVALPEQEFMMIGRQQDAFVVRYRANAYRAGFRSPIFAFRAGPAIGPRAITRLRFEKRRDEIALRLTSRDTTIETGFRISAARVWATFLPFDHGFGVLGVAGDLLWLGLLVGPSGYGGVRTRIGWRGMLPVSALTAVIAVLALGWQPALWWWPYWATVAFVAAAAAWLGRRSRAVPPAR